MEFHLLPITWSWFSGIIKVEACYSDVMINSAPLILKCIQVWMMLWNECVCLPIIHVLKT